MVASTRGLDELASSQSTINDRSQQQQQTQQSQHNHYHLNHNQYNQLQQQQQQQQQQNHHHHHHHPQERPVIGGYRQAQTAQDKRSRLSNVINNLRKKVPSDSTASVHDSRRTKDSSHERELNNQHREDEDDARNSVERNLANLEKYVMTVLNGVIKDAESKDEVKADAERTKISTELAKDAQNPVGSGHIEILARKEDESDDPHAGSTEPSRPNESRLEAAVPPQPETTYDKTLVDDKTTTREDDKSENSELSNDISRVPSHENDGTQQRLLLSEPRATESASVVAKKSNDPHDLQVEPHRRTDNDVDRLSGTTAESRLSADATVNAEVNELPRTEKQVNDEVNELKSSLSHTREIPEKENDAKDSTIVENTEIPKDTSVIAAIDDNRANNRSLGTIILDRLTDHHTATSGEIAEASNEANSEFRSDNLENSSENEELRLICRDLLNELLNDISQLIDETPAGEESEIPADGIILEDVKESHPSLDLANTSIHCSLPLEKVAAVLQNCQNSQDTSPLPSPSGAQQTSKASPKLPSPTVRHLCLYCDRKFLSISLRQRHTDRVHQLGGGRRSERNSRKTTQNCQYCSDKCADSLDGLFHHMIGKHGDKYHACVQCITRYSTKDVLVNHMSDVHGFSNDKVTERQDKAKENSTFKEPAASRDISSHSGRDKTETVASSDRRLEEDQEQRGSETITNPAKPNVTQSTVKDVLSNPGSPEFDSSFYSSVSCNIRENLLHHLDGKLQPGTSSIAGACNETKSQIQPQQQSFYEHGVNQIQFPIDISLTAATPVYNKEYGASDEYENSSEYAQKPGKTGRSHPRRVSFEKYNFPRKYDGKEQWSCSIKDLSKFDISTQLSLRKKQQVIKERLTINRLQHTTIVDTPNVADSGQTEVETSENESEPVRRNSERFEDARILDAAAESSAIGSPGRTSGIDQSISSVSESDAANNEQNLEDSTTDPESSQDSQCSNATVFTAEFGSFLKLRMREERKNSEAGSSKEIIYAELTGEWSRPRIYICGACTSRHVTLREMEEHKASSHPNVWCSHLEFTGDQRELYKHLFLPGRCLATTKAKNAVLSEKVCTKCSKVCGSLAELHRHMLECGGDQAWLLGLFGNGKKKCKWRPFGSRSRRRRQRGMKRNIQNSQTPRVNQPRERNSSGPRVRPSDRESIQKMLANLPPKRASRRVMQETTVRTQGRLRKMQTRSRPRLVEPTPSNSRLSRKAVLRNKLLKHAKSFQRKICRGDNITAAIESVVKKSDAEEDVDDESGEEDEEEEDDVEDDSGRVFKESIKFQSTKSRGETSKGRWNLESSNRSTKIVRGVRVVSKKRNVKSKEAHTTTGNKVRKRVIANRRTVDNATSSNSKNGKNSLKNNDKTAANSTSDNQTDNKSQSSNSSTPSHSAILRRKKHVDPVVSLHASLKARNQLRTHDGKFARTSDVRGMRSTSSLSEGKTVATPASQNLRTRGRRQDAGRLVTRAKLRAARRASNDAKVTRRTVVKRISSDSDKMPTLEVADVKTDNEEKSSVKSVAELPILTPVASVIGKSEQKNSRGSSRSSSTTKVNSANQQQQQQQAKNSTELDLDDAIDKNVIDVTQIKNSVQNTSQEQRPTRARRKKVLRDVEKSEEAEPVKGKDESPARVADSARDFRAKNRTSLPARASSSTDYSEESSRRRCTSKDSKPREVEDEEIVKKSPKSELQSPTRKNEPSRPVDSRQARQERRTGSLEDFSKLQDVSDEVKKLLGPSDDLFTQIGLKKREKTKKNTRQPPKAKANTPKPRVQKKNSNVDDSRADESEQESDQKEKIGLRKSPRYAEKKNVASTIAKTTEVVESADESIEVLVTDKNSDKLEKDTKAEGASIENNLSDELEDNPKVNNSLGKRRGRIKSRVEEEDTQSSSQSQSNIETEKEDTSEKEEDESKETVSSPEETTESTIENLEAIEDNSEDVPKDLSTSTDVATLSFEHLQQESNNSNIDSGKENSSETPVNVSKLKVVRPKKSRGLRRDRMAKRTLNNVIGILTEGVNIPVEVQQSVVLTVQTSIEGVTPESGVQSNPSQMADNNVAAGEVSNVRASVKPNESSDAACSSGADEESGESATQVPQQIESETIGKSKENGSLAEHTDTNVQIQCYSLTEVIPAAPIPAKLVDNVPPAAVEQPTNDIILDLSRRKPKGKGSFLEKIVSKIAKQKDALLESEVGCHLDNSPGEITKIIDQVNTPRTTSESAESSKPNDKNSINPEKVDSETTILPDTKQSKDDQFVAPSAKSVAKEIPSNQNADNAVSVQTMVTIDEPKNQGEIEVQPTEEQTLGSGILPNSSQEFSAAPEPPVDPVGDEEVPNLESKRTSKKRSLDAVAPKKNKRKTVETNEGEKDSSEDEICLADIMKLINRSKQSSPKIDEKTETKVRPGKRKTMDQDKDESLSTIADSDTEPVAASNDKKKPQSNVTEVNKKSKRNNAKKSQISEEATIETVADKINPVDEAQQENVLKDSELETKTLANIDQNCAEDLSTPNSIIEVQTSIIEDAKVEAISEIVKPLIEVLEEPKVEETSEIAKSLDAVEENSSKKGKQPQSIVLEDKTKSKTTRKRAAKKKSLADEHLDLPDDEPSQETCRQQKEELAAPAITEVAPELNPSPSAEVMNSVVTAESFKVPESNEFLESTKRRRTKKKSLAAEHLDLLDDVTHSLSSNILPPELIDDVINDSNTLAAEIIKDVEKSKEEINIVEENSVSVVSMTMEKLEGEKSIEAPSVFDDPVVSEHSEDKTSCKDQSVENAEEQDAEDVQTDASVTDCESVDAEGDTAEGRRNLTRKAKDNAPGTDELAPFSDAKLQRKFAVVHTKSGKMLIVEKKKKFTKEAAKFFCEVCAASFTRKSSLKKHNSSQFHLMQLSKCGEENERDAATTLEEDATISSIDASNDVSTGVELAEIAKEPTIMDDDAIQNIVENIEKPTIEEAIVENLIDEVLETNEQEKCDIIVPLVNQPDESTFGTPDLLEEDLEDELLDEEICKITENMTHDEYVLTDHVSPVLPEAASTPVNVPTNLNIPERVEKLIENKEEKNTAKQLEKKRNLADEHLDLDSPIPSDILADLTVSSILEEGIEKTLDIIPILHIPELSKSPSDLTIITALDKQIIEEKSESCQSIAINILVDVDKSTVDEENLIPEKSLRSKRKNSKKCASKVEDTSKNDVLLEDPKDSLLADIEISNISTIDEKSIVQPEEVKDVIIENANDEPILEFLPKTSNDFKEPPKVNMTMTLDFSNITEKLKAQESSTKDTSCTTEFDSSEDSSDTNMSDDIRKILDDPELDADNKQTVTEVQSKNKKPENPEALKTQTPVKEVDILATEAPVTSAKKTKQQKGKSAEINDTKMANNKNAKQNVQEDEKKSSTPKNNEKKSTRNKNTVKEPAKKTRATKPKRNNNSLKNKAPTETSDSEYDEKKDGTESQNKSKIVKCVFGRVFGGEKVDKVKEVLDDWVSRSEGDSQEDSQTTLDSSTAENFNAPAMSPLAVDAKRSRKDDDKSTKRHSRNASPSKSPSPGRTRSRNRKQARSKNPTKETNLDSDDPNADEFSTERRSRSKSGAHTRRRNAEKKADSIPATKTLEQVELTPSSRSRQSKTRAKEQITRFIEDDVEFDALISGFKAGGKNKKEPREGKKTREEDLKAKKLPTTSTKNKKRTPEEDPEEDEEAQASDDEKTVTTTSRNNPTPSSKRERSPSPDDNSQKTLPSINDDERSNSVEAEEEDENEIALGRLSPLYVCNSPASSMDSDTNSEEEDNVTEERENRTRRRSTSEFTGEKVVIRSPTSSLSNREDRTEVVTIAPTDAIEDNALDVPREIATSPGQKPRQGKVLNFDEELFVECCSRLKATTENELRGAKKIKLDHSEAYNRNEDQATGFRGNRDRWRDVESQNSLGSLLESVNQLLGEEMYSGSRTNEYPKRGRNAGSERSSRTASPEVDANRQETLGYEDSLDVAFEHNNKLRVKIQQRMRESENLIASTFGQKSSGSLHRHHHHHHHRQPNHQRHHENAHHHRRDNRPIDHARKEHANESDRLTDVNQGVHNGGNYGNLQDDKSNDRSVIDQSTKHVELDCSNFRSKNPALGGLLDKALSNLLHSNGKHDHNGSTPMNVLAELACARVPTATVPEVNSLPEKSSAKSPTRVRESSTEERDRSIVNNKDPAPKKARNPIKELFERKKVINERKQHQQERSESDVALRELNVQRQKKSKKPKRQQQQQQQQHQQGFPLIRKGQLGGMVERKKRRDGAERKAVHEDTGPERIKDIYDFDEEESQPETGPVLSYRLKNDKSYEVMSCLKTKEFDMTDLMTKTIGETLKNGKAGDALGRRLESMISRKFQEIETFAPKTKGALKSFHMEEKQQQEQKQQQQQQQQQVTGPMDDFVERKQRSRKLTEPSTGKHGRSKRRSKNSKKKSRNAWYENDSSDEFRTAAKAEDVGVGISKSQRTCSKGKQNLFAELSTSSESEYEEDDGAYETKRRLARMNQKKIIEEEREKEHCARISPELADNYPQEQEDHGVDDWLDVTSKTDSKNDLEHKKSESEMSDHPLVIDERKTETDEPRNSDDDTETRYNPTFELDDLYREDSSVADSDPEEESKVENEELPEETKTQNEEVVINDKSRYSEEKELIPLEEALNLLDNNEDLANIPERLSAVARSVETLENQEKSTEIVEKASNPDDDEVENEELENETAEASMPEEPEEELSELPEKLSSNEKPPKASENLPLHVFLSRKVQESKKRKQQQQKKLQEEQEKILMEFAPTRRQRKCAIGKQGLLAEISSSDEESYTRETCRRSAGEKSDHERQSRKPKRESKEKRKERYMEKKHEQIIAKEQKAIEEEILRELEKTKGSSTKCDSDSGKSDVNTSKNDSILSDKSEAEENHVPRSTPATGKKKRQQKSKKPKDDAADVEKKITDNIDQPLKTSNAERKSNTDESLDNVVDQDSPSKSKRQSKSSQRAKKSAKTPETKATSANRKSKISNSEKTKNKQTSTISKEPKERRASSGKRDSDDEELRTTKCWNKVEEGVGVAIGRRKRAAANQLYYWSSSSDDDEPIPAPTTVVEEEDDRQEQHGWIVGDSHKRMITMLAMEKQLKEKRRRSEDEFEPGKTKNKKHRNSTS